MLQESQRPFRRPPSWRARCVLAVALPAAVPAFAQPAAQLLDATVSTQVSSDSAAQSSQLRISQLADETSELLGRYRLATQQLDRVTAYNDNLTRLISDQEQEKASIKRQLEDFVVVEQGIVPLMIEMIDALEQFISLDLPFQLDERMDRVARLRDNMDKADITISEKYRQIMDAYMIETDFGRTIEAYVDTLPVDGVPTEVDVLRVGRTLLAYQTPDRAATGFFDPSTKTWQPLPDEYRTAVTEGLRVARRQAAPDLLRLPVSAPEDLR
jgi:Protein of unknown function (DUF3450)